MGSDLPLRATLYPFQAEGAALCALRPRNLAIWSTGIGKTLLAIATSCLLVDEVDTVLVVAEKSKVSDWSHDFTRFADPEVMSPVIYEGTPAKREALRGRLDEHRVVCGSYEVVRRDLALPVAKGRRALQPGPLMEALAGRRVLVVLDEVAAKCSNRSSQTYRALSLLIDRKQDAIRVLGLTATPLTRNPASTWNLVRLIDKETAGTVQNFEQTYIEGYNFWGEPTSWRHLEDAPPGVVSLRERLAPVITTKSKFDEDVVDQFPSMVEEPEWTLPSKEERKLLRVIHDCLEDESGLMVLRQATAHPHSLLTSESALARRAVAEFGEERLRAIEPTKAARLMEMLLRLQDQGAQSVVFTFFGQSILPLLMEAMGAAGVSYAEHHGQMSADERDEAKARFVSGEAEVFLSSDAGARGLNLPQATHVIQFEPPLTWADFEQRANRHHRIDSKHPSVTAVTMIARDTVEEAIVGLVLARNQWTEQITGVGEAEGELSAHQRRALIERAAAMV